jgi:uncharacterized repeat protein (TIGR01451 family)
MNSIALKKLASVLMLAGLSSNFATAQTVEWISNDAASIEAMTADDAENTFTLSNYTGSLTIGGDNFNSAGMQDQLITKYDTDGNVLWSTSVGSSAEDTGESIEYDGISAVWIVGNTYGDFNAGTFSFTGNGNSDGFLVKLDVSSGNVLFATAGGGSGEDIMTDLSEDDNGDIYISGNSNSADFSWDGMTHSTMGGTDGFVTKYLNNGTASYMKTMESAADDNIVAIDYNVNGDCIALCETSSAVGVNTFDSGVTNIGDEYFFSPVPLTAGGTGTGGAFFGFTGTLVDIECDAYGGIYYMGTGTQSTNNGWGTGNEVQAAGGTDIFIGKVQWYIQPVGWTKAYGGIGNETAKDFTSDSDGNIYVVGSFDGDCTLGSDNYNPMGDSKSFIARLDTAGVVQWSAETNGSAQEQNFNAVTTSGPDYAFAGGYGSPFLSVGNLSNTVSVGYNVKFNDQTNYISGETFMDNNSNMIFDMGDYPHSPSLIMALDGTEFTAVNLDGGYSFTTLDGTYDVTLPNLPLYKTLLTPATQSANFTGFGNYDTDNPFALVDIPNMNDIDADLYTLGPIKEGQTFRYYLNTSNVGTTDLDVEITLEVDNALVFNASSSAPTSQTATTYTWDLGTLSSGNSTSPYVDFDIPVGTAVGTVLAATLTANPLVGDETPSNNVDTNNDTIVAAYDPNYKTVFPTSENNIVAPSVLEYEIHFQNLGNSEANDVILIDTLSSMLDVSTLQIVGSSHSPMELIIENNNIIKLSFPGIDLPDSTTNPLGSIGFVKFKIQQDGTLPLNNSIENFADIYFDYNPAVRTDTAFFTHLAEGSGISENSIGEIKVFPNPTSNELNIFIKENALVKSISILDVSGRLISNTNVNQFITNYQLDVNALSRGVYFVRIESNDEFSIVKFQKQ